MVGSVERVRAALIRLSGACGPCSTSRPRNRSSTSRHKIRPTPPTFGRRSRSGVRNTRSSPLAAQPDRIAVGTRSNALYDRCATEGARPSGPKNAGECAGQATRAGSQVERYPPTVLLTSGVFEPADLKSRQLHFRCSEAGWWACQDLNLGPHPYQQSRAKRYADEHFPRSNASVRREVIRCSPGLVQVVATAHATDPA
jgi:hypothetical protein